MKIALIVVAAVLIILQFFRTENNNGVSEQPTDITHVVQVPDNVLHTLQAACYDCHSNHTDYPWYAHINPVGMWLASHINEGKGELNFSEFANYKYKRADHKLEEIEEQVEKGEMPLDSYTWIHKDARLSQQQVNEISAWVKQARAELKANNPQ